MTRTNPSINTFWFVFKLLKHFYMSQQRPFILSRVNGRAGPEGWRCPRCWSRLRTLDNSLISLCMWRHCRWGVYGCTSCYRIGFYIDFLFRSGALSAPLSSMTVVIRKNKNYHKCEHHFLWMSPGQLSGFTRVEIIIIDDKRRCGALYPTEGASRSLITASGSARCYK